MPRKLKGNLYEQPRLSHCVGADARQGTRLLHHDGPHSRNLAGPSFLKMLLGGIRWATGRVDADIRANFNDITPHGSEIPPHAAKYIASTPPLPNPQFPGFNVHFPQFTVHRSPEAVAGPPRHVLFFSKSAGIEHPVAYREADNCCFLEREMIEFGAEYNIDFIFSKDGTFITPENLAKFDAIVFYTSGDLTNQPAQRPGRQLPAHDGGRQRGPARSGPRRQGVCWHSLCRRYFQLSRCAARSDAADSYARMLATGCKGVGGIQKRAISVVDKNFPAWSMFRTVSRQVRSGFG